MKEQAASITCAKIDEICQLIPALANEINFDRGASKKSKNDVKYIFKNGSVIDVLAAKESSRGQRRTGGLMEECVLIDQTALNEIVIPTTNVTRLLPDGTRNNTEVVNKSQIYITTAGWRSSFAYSKLIELLIMSLIEPDEVMIMGGTYETPVVEGLLDEDFVDQLKSNGTYAEDSFDREYRSIWSGDAVNAFFSSDNFDKYRVLLQPEYEHSGRSSKSAYYILGVDVGRLACTTEVSVIKVTPQPTGPFLKSIVNLYTLEAEHFEDQAIEIKKIYYKYKARTIALDANGIGAGFVDFLTRGQIDPETGEELPPFGVEGGTAEDATDPYKKIKGVGVENDALFLIKANAPLNTEMYSYTKVQMLSGKVKFLQDEASAKAKLMETKLGQNMSTAQRETYLKPFVLTTALKSQMMNLVEENEGVNIILKPDSKSIKHDKFSALIYGLYYIKKEEESRNRKRKFSIKDLMMMN
jgi:hypothetical protein